MDHDEFPQVGEVEVTTSIVNGPAEVHEREKQEALDRLRDCDGFILIALKDRESEPVSDTYGFFSCGPTVVVAELLAAHQSWVDAMNQQIELHDEELDDV